MQGVAGLHETFCATINAVYRRMSEGHVRLLEAAPGDLVDCLSGADVPFALGASGSRDRGHVHMSVVGTVVPIETVDRSRTLGTGAAGAAEVRVEVPDYSTKEAFFCSDATDPGGDSPRN